MSKGYRQGAWAAGLGIAALLVVGTVVGAMLPSLASAHENQVFFRGGFAALNSNRANEVFTDVFGRNGQLNDASTGYYVGAGLDLLMHKNFLGLNGMSLLGEVGAELKRFESKTVTQAVPSTCAAAGITQCSIRVNKVQLTMLTVDIAPKLKFMEKGKFHPWIIPIGLDFHVISPPSNATNYLDIGVQWGAGVEYNIFGPFILGLDGRYHLTANMTQTTNSFGTIGAYLGVGF